MSMSEPQPIEKTLDLVERAQRDDSAALEQLFERYLPRVRNIAAIRLGRARRELLDIDDVAQEAMLDAFRGLDRFDLDSDGKFCNWLATIVENRIRMTLRAGSAIKRGSGNVQRFADAPKTMHASQLQGDGSTPSMHAAGSELTEQMETGLQQLSEEYREVIVQRVFCQMTFSEIAESMQLRNGDAVRSVYTKALLALRTHMEPHADTGSG